MYIDELRTFCLSFKEVEESFPFDEDTLVFKVKNKMFALTSLKTGNTVNLKCDPERAIELRERYPNDIIEGYHMNKKHWNTVTINGSLSDDLLCELIQHSYQLVIASLSKKDRESLL